MTDKRYDSTPTTEFIPKEFDSMTTDDQEIITSARVEIKANKELSEKELKQLEWYVSETAFPEILNEGLKIEYVYNPRGFVPLAGISEGGYIAPCSPEWAEAFKVGALDPTKKMACDRFVCRKNKPVLYGFCELTFTQGKTPTEALRMIVDELGDVVAARFFTSAVRVIGRLACSHGMVTRFTSAKAFALAMENTLKGGRARAVSELQKTVSEQERAIGSAVLGMLEQGGMSVEVVAGILGKSTQEIEAIKAQAVARRERQAALVEETVDGLTEEDLEDGLEESDAGSGDSEAEPDGTPDGDVKPAPDVNAASGGGEAGKAPNDSKKTKLVKGGKKK